MMINEYVGVYLNFNVLINILVLQWKFVFLLNDMDILIFFFFNNIGIGYCVFILLIMMYWEYVFFVLKCKNIWFFGFRYGLDILSIFLLSILVNLGVICK